MFIELSGLDSAWHGSSLRLQSLRGSVKNFSRLGKAQGKSGLNCTSEGDNRLVSIKYARNSTFKYWKFDNWSEERAR